jgi:iron complex outermembrane receptor protein
VPVEDLPAGHPCNDEGFSNVFNGVRGGNRDLQPTESDQWTAGFVLNLFQDLTLNVDYYYIDITDEVDQLTYQQKLDEEFALRQAGETGNAVGDVTRRAGGRLDTITSLQTNIGTKKTEGLDAEVSYGFSMGRFGDLNTTLYWTHVLEYEESDVEDPTRTLHLDGNVFYPKNRGQLTVGWNMGDYSATIVGNYTSRQNDAPFCAEDDEDCYWASWVTWDVQVAYATPWNGMITVGARNVLDRDPPNNDGFFDTFQADVFGRVPYIRWEQDL